MNFWSSNLILSRKKPNKFKGQSLLKSHQWLQVKWVKTRLMI